MRWVGVTGLVALWMLGGCRQIFGIGDPDPAGTGDAPPMADARLSDGHVPSDAPPFLQACSAQDTSLIGCWEFEGNLIDSGPHHFDVMPSSPPSYVAGHTAGGQAIVTNTIDLNVADSADLDVNSVTIAAWVYVTTMPAGNVHSAILDNNSEYALYVESNGSIRCYAGASTANMSNVIMANTWTHVACTGGGSTLRAYVDGQQVATGILAGIPTGSTTGLTLGSDNPSGNGARLNGWLDDVRLYNRALSPKEVCRLHDPNC
ncbi:MAG: LamG domain-containing protein [Deltaproteobacteria bacterium]